jgi:hypothetical protein
MHIEKKSLFSKMAAPAAKSNSIHSRRVDLSKPAPAPRLLTASPYSSGKHISKTTIEI